MPLKLREKVFITAAITGSGSTQDRSPHVPRSPTEIATAAIDAAKAGAAIVHCHVRDPETGTPSRSVALYRQVTQAIRESEVDVVINLRPYLIIESVEPRNITNNIDSNKMPTEAAM